MSIYYETAIVSHPEHWGDGYLAGSVPPDPNPDELDGRAKILNVPSRVHVAVFDRRTMYCVAIVLSSAAGTWMVPKLNRSRQYLIIGYDGNNAVNAAVQDCVTPAEME